MPISALQIVDLIVKGVRYETLKTFSSEYDHHSYDCIKWMVKKQC